MKRLCNFLLTLTLIAALSYFCLYSCLAAEVIDYTDGLTELETGTAKDFLENNGILTSDPETVRNLDAGSLISHFIDIFKASLKAPASMLIILAGMGFLSVIIPSGKPGVDKMTAIAAFLLIYPFISSSLETAFSAVSSQQAFMTAYIPIFAGITLASGNAMAAGSYNALVFYASETAGLIAGGILKPFLTCMLVLSCTQSICPQLPDITYSLRRLFSAILGTVMTVFVGIIGLQTAIGRTGSEIILRAGKYLVSSFVPIIGMSLSESYKTVRLSISAIKSSTGGLGIVIMVLIMSVPIISLFSCRLAISAGEWLCRLTGSEPIASLARGIANVYSLIITFLIIYAMMFIISTGFIMLFGSEAV